MDAFPNPFTSCVLFSLPAEESGKVRLQIFDVVGRTIYHSEQRKPNSGATRIYWNGVDNLGRTVPIGVYLFRLDLNHVSHTGRLVKLE
ncbi:MAG: T9SS type A sorting domain-containing protein [candidate division WOR-3 bacterium]|nr:T9SS type A sorting domain-containing protein [candidate division WOR-3 bacterium]